MAAKLPDVPPALKSLAHYMKTAVEHDKRDPVIAYWCRLYALQRAMAIDTKRECKNFLLGMMDYLEQAKKTAKNDESIAEAISSEEVGSAYVENYADKIFEFADNSDRSGRFDRDVIKSFYTAGLLMEVMEVFKEGVSPEVNGQNEFFSQLQDKRKYAKMKALYLNKCMKSKVTPIPGPLRFNEGGGPNNDEGAIGQPSVSPYPDSNQPPPDAGYFPPAAGNQPSYPQPPNNYQDPSGYNSAPSRPDTFLPTPPVGYGSAPAPGQASPSLSKAPPPTPTQQWTPKPASVSLTPDQVQKAQKYSKYACSALQYEDVNTAVINLEKALILLTTGQDT